MSAPFHTANKRALGGLGGWLVGRVLMQSALTRAFGGVYAKVAPATLILRRRRDLPILFCATHSGWWDGHMAYLLNKRLFRRDAYVMMEEAQLARYRFFTWVGAFGVDRHDPRSALASVRYITGVLSQRESVALWIFPQGEMQHPDLRPIRIYGGAVNIARRLGRCALVPVALRYDFLREQAPDAFAYLGAPLLVEEGGKGGSDLPARLQSAMTHTADALRADVTSHNLAEYRRVLLGRGSVNAHWDGVRLLVRRLFGRNQYEL